MISKILSYRKIVFTYIFILIVSVFSVYAQAPLGELQSVRIDDNQDTLIINRLYGDYWFGVYGGVQFNNFFGELNVNSIPNQLNNPFNRIVSFGSGVGAGYNIGGIFEYNPKGEMLGYILKFNFLDSRDFSTGSVSIRDTFNTSYDASSKISQFMISPGVRYNTPIEGLHLYGGLNLEFALSSDSRLIRKFFNGGNIREDNIIKFEDLSLGYGANVGVAYDFMMADISQRSRAYVTPYAEMQFRSSMIADNSSSWSSLILRLGMQIKVGIDEISVDTLYFDPSYVLPPQYLASVGTLQSVAFDIAATPRDEIETNFIEYIPFEKMPDEVVGGEITIARADTSKIIEAELPKKDIARAPQTNITLEKRSNVVPTKGVQERFSFPKSNNTTLTQDMRNYLKKVAQFMKENPGSKVIIVGHSDMGASLELNTTRARNRAKNVEKYLLSLGIPQGRIIASWKGTLFAIAPNDTEEGRYKNRRVEITIE